MVADQIEQLHAHIKVELVIIKTTGDRIQNRPLHDVGGKGLFIKELEQALLAGEIDFAAHSLKDIPVTMPLVDQSALVIAAYPKREDPRDVLVSRTIRAINDLPQGAHVGTGSLRRRAQLLALRPDLRIEALRGNIDTRIRKCLEGKYDALVLALAGVRRATLFDAQTMAPISTDQLIPAAGQGALALQCRVDDLQTRDILASLHDHNTGLCVNLERSFVAALNGDCVSPIGAYAKVTGRTIVLAATVAKAGGKLPVISASAKAPLDHPSNAVNEVLKSLENQGVYELLHPALYAYAM
jgi:hydroxymethylbilane synthase